MGQPPMPPDSALAGPGRAAKNGSSPLQARRLRNCARRAKVRLLRERIADQDYINDLKLNVALDRLLDEIHQRVKSTGPEH